MFLPTRESNIISGGKARLTPFPLAPCKIYAGSALRASCNNLPSGDMSFSFSFERMFSFNLTWHKPCENYQEYFTKQLYIMLLDTMRVSMNADRATLYS